MKQIGGLLGGKELRGDKLKGIISRGREVTWGIGAMGDVGDRCDGLGFLLIKLLTRFCSNNIEIFQ